MKAEFQNKFFEGTGKKEWDNWKWHIKNAITDIDVLDEMFNLTADEKSVAESGKVSFPFRITPYYASLFYEKDPENPLRKTMIPLPGELIDDVFESNDPLNEDSMLPVPNIIHRYPDRVLFLATEYCSAYCRFCTRHRVVGHKDELYRFSSETCDQGLEYIAKNSSIRDVLISGGDPLMLSDSRIEYLLSKIKAIPHVEIVRIGTKMPVVLPQRITKTLVKTLKKYHPLYLSIHFTHPSEITPETKHACKMLADAGIPLGSQTVLLKGVNNDAAVLSDLFKKLIAMRVKPYYLYHCDPVQGSKHFRTSIDEGLKIMEQLRGFISGYAVPTYVIDAPGGGGKIPMLPGYFQYRDDNFVYLKNYEGKQFKYPDPMC